MRTVIINNSLTRTISTTRLTQYLSETQDNLEDAITLYERNTRLSEAFYTPLQCLEVCFRNSLDIHMVNVYGVDWFRNGSAPLNNAAQQAIAEAYQENKKPNPIPAGDIVAELKFSFWVSLLGPGYDSSLWRKALYKGFQTGAGKKRSDVHGRLNSIRRFRNRVAHHEPIFHSNLEETHTEIIEAIGWMCPDTKEWAKHLSRVPSVLAGQ